ncbi:MAG: 30S ribosome-binding factor RbfA [Chitinophagaceae bacterium]|nr:MAG: 30S ribosome-binding factor RbfA [Chitinophagaceae bacterium]
MEEGKRQKQVAGLIQEEVNDIFRRLGLGMMDGGMVSVSAVKITPDLLEARIYVSFFQVADPKATLKKVTDRAWEVKRELASRIKTQVRRMPELRFFYDDTLDYVFKMENIFDQIKKEDGQREEGRKDEETNENT